MDMLLLYKSLTVNDIDYGRRVHGIPNGLLAIGASARSIGYDVDIYNLSCFSERTENEFLANLPSVNYLIGLTQLTLNRHAVYALAKKLRKHYPQIPIVIGGVHASLFPEEILRGHPEIDYIVLGEADFTIQELLSVLQNSGNVKNVENLAWRSNGRVYVNKRSSGISNLDDLPYTQDYYADNLVLSSRGCPYKCAFCAANKNCRMKSVDRVMNELNKLIQIRGISHAAFVDDLFAVNEKRVKEMTTGILSLPGPLTYTCTLRANVTTEAMIQNLVKSGCTIAYIGFESGSDEVLRIYQKRITSNDIIKAIQICRNYCLDIAASLIFSGVHDNESSFEKTKLVLEKAQPTDISVNALYLAPGSYLYDEAVAAGEVDAGIWEQSDEGQPEEAFAGYPEKLARARKFISDLIDFFRHLKKSIQYTTRECETAWKKYGYSVMGLKLAYCYLDDRRFLESYELLDELEKKGYKHLDVYSGKAFSLAGLDKGEEGLQKLSEWEEYHPLSKEYWLRKGLLFEQIAHYDEAIESYKNVYNPIDGGYEELMRIAVVHEKAGNIAAALETYQNIIDTYHIYSKNVNYFVLGKIKYLENQKSKKILH